MPSRKAAADIEDRGGCHLHVAKRRANLRGEAIPPVAQEDLGTGAVELVGEHSSNAMPLGLEIGAELALAELGVVHVHLEAVLRAVEVGIVRGAAAAIQGDDRMFTGHLNQPNIC